MSIFKKLIAVILIHSVTSTANAQKPENLLDKWAAKSPIEKVYLHIDRDIYRAGETAWFTI